MARHYTNTGCPLYATSYCSMLNMTSCEGCTVNLRKQDDISRLKEDLEVMRGLMPEDGISDLFTGDKCVLCKGEEKGDTACYGVVDLGNPEPVRKKRNAIGLKVTTRAGSLVPVQLSCCSACRRRFMLIDSIVPLLSAITAAVLVILLSIRPIGEAITAVWRPLPFIIFVAGLLLAVAVSYILRASMKRKYAELTHLDIFELPKLAAMKEKGWFLLIENRNKGVTKLVFSTKRMAQGVYTGEQQDFVQPQAASPEDNG